MKPENDKIHLTMSPDTPTPKPRQPSGPRRDRSAVYARFNALLGAEPELGARFERVRWYASTIRSSEYHLTNACNIRCKGCWFFQHEFDRKTKDERDLGKLREFIARECARGINSALLIGGEPTLFPERVAAYAEQMTNVTISTNGLTPMPFSGFENTTVAVSLFGGGTLDDELRAIKPSGQRFTGLFSTALRNYRYDPRTIFIYAITERGADVIEETVRRIADNGNVATLNFYSQYDASDPLKVESTERLLDAALRVKDLYPNAILSTPYYIKVMVTGKTDWGEFSYDVCPSISVDHPAHAERMRNGNPTLPLFNAYAPDLKTVQFCCTSGHCHDCRDSQAVFSWLMVSAEHFIDSVASLRLWIEMAESYWSQFVWSPFHRGHGMRSARIDASGGQRGLAAAAPG